MTIEDKWWSWKPSLYTEYRIRVANELRLAQRHEYCNELRRQIANIQEDITEILQKMAPIDFTQINQKIDSCMTLCQVDQKHILKECNQVKEELVHLIPKLLIGNAYICARYNEISLKTQPINNRKQRKRLKLTIEQQWRKGIAAAYQKLLIQRDKEEMCKHNQSVSVSMPQQSLSIINGCPRNEPPINTEIIIDQMKEHKFLTPLPPTPDNELIIPFQTPPPILCQTSPSDRLQLAVDDTIVKSHRHINKTLGNISHVSFRIDPDQCSSPKPEEKKKKTKLKKLTLPLATAAVPPPPLFSSTAIFDTHAFFTQTNIKTKKQKKKIDISRQPVIMAMNDAQKKRTRTKKSSPYDFQDEDSNALSRSKGTKLLTDDIITARFAKNSHYQSHQTSMASNKSSKSQHKTKEREHRKKKKNILGIGTSSPLIMPSTNLTMSPGQLSSYDKNDDYEIKSSLSKRPNRTKPTNKSRRKRVK